MFLFTHMGRLSGVGEACAPLRGKQLAELKSITNAYPLGGKLIKLLNGFNLHALIQAASPWSISWGFGHFVCTFC